MYPTSPSRKSGNMMCHGARRLPWNTMFWVEELTDRKVKVEVVAQKAMALMEIGNGEEWKIGEEA